MIQGGALFQALGPGSLDGGGPCPGGISSHQPLSSPRRLQLWQRTELIWEAQLSLRRPEVRGQAAGWGPRPFPSSQA